MWFFNLIDHYLYLIDQFLLNFTWLITISKTATKRLKLMLVFQKLENIIIPLLLDVSLFKVNDDHWRLFQFSNFENIQVGVISSCALFYSIFSDQSCWLGLISWYFSSIRRSWSLTTLLRFVGLLCLRWILISPSRW